MGPWALGQPPRFLREDTLPPGAERAGAQTVPGSILWAQGPPMAPPLSGFVPVSFTSRFADMYMFTSKSTSIFY